MRAFAVSSESYSAFLYLQPTPFTHISQSLLFSDPFKGILQPHQSFSSIASSRLLLLCSSKFRPFLYCTPNPDPTTLRGDGVVNNAIDVDGDDDFPSGARNLLLVDDEVEANEESIAEDGVYIEVKKLEKNSRRIESSISIHATLTTVWNILTDYERLPDFIPGLAISQLLEKGDNYARIFQIGQQNLAFGLKFNAKGIIDCYEKELESLPSGLRRDIEFKMIDGDFQLFEGKWSILQSESCGESEPQEISTTLSYTVDVKPKLWLPVRLIEGRLCNEIKMNLTSIRDEAQKATQGTLHAH